MNERLHELVEKDAANICEIAVMKDGNLIYEDYWRGYKRGDNLNVMSVTKAVMALLTGIAIDRGYLKSVDEKVISFFPDYTIKRGEKTILNVTLRHLLTMTAPYKYKSEPWTKVCTSDDWTKAALDLLGGRSGITGEFKYSTLGIQILSGILEEVTNQKVIEFANEALFTPLGIDVHEIHSALDKDDMFRYLMDKNPRKPEWYADPQGSVTAGWGLTLSALDMAKIGAMLQAGGVYEGKRIISEGWIHRMTHPYQKLGEQFGNMSYGFLWWLPKETNETCGEYSEQSDAVNVFAAIGDGGNVIYVNRELGVSVGVAGTFKPRIFDRVEFIEREILPAVLGYMER